REEATKRLFNTSVLVAPDGKVASYRKVYPANFGPFEEGLYFGRGDGLTLAETKLGRIGLLICYDAFFPELSKAYALPGADLLPPSRYGGSGAPRHSLNSRSHWRVSRKTNRLGLRSRWRCPDFSKDVRKGGPNRGPFLRGPRFEARQDARLDPEPINADGSED